MSPESEALSSPKGLAGDAVAYPEAEEDVAQGVGHDLKALVKELR